MNASTKRDNPNDAKFRTPFNYDKDKASLVSGKIFTKPTLTQKHQRDETDINVIVQRFGVTGMLPQAAVLPTYGDFFAAGDYQTSMNLIIKAQKAFDALPANTRRYFGNDPASLLAFIDASPDAQLVLDLGLGHLVSKPPETKPAPEPKPAPTATEPKA